MPELPEVECVRRSLVATVVGRRITAATLRRRDVLTVVGTRRAAPAALLEGAAIDRVERLGKHLAIIADDGRVLEVHLGMTGQVLVVENHAGVVHTHVHAVWMLDAERGGPRLAMLFRDPRRFGGLWALPTYEALREQRWQSLGPDALEITSEHLSRCLARTRRAVKAALLDQGVLAGIGNIYADEALYLAGIHPGTPGVRVGAAAASRLAAAIRQVLREAIAGGGSTLRDYLDPAGTPGSYQLSRRVYGRQGEPCPTCGQRLKHTRIGGRTTTFCARCQTRDGRPRAGVKVVVGTDLPTWSAHAEKAVREGTVVDINPYALPRLQRKKKRVSSSSSF